MEEKTQKHSRKSVGVMARGVFRVFLSAQRKILAGVLVVTLTLINARAFIAFEAHIVNVTAEIAKIDAPLVTPLGGVHETAPTVSVMAEDNDATHIFYTLTPGTNPDVADDPYCGDSLGGAKGLVSPFTVAQDSVVKAVACNGDTVEAKSSIIAVEVYDILDPFGRVRGYKYFDADTSGSKTVGDYGLAGWQITLKHGTSTVAITSTDQSGFYEFSNIPVGVYDVVEESRDGWQAVSSPQISVTLEINKTVDVDFFNFSELLQCIATNVNFPHGLAVQVAGEGSEHNDDVVFGANVTVNGDVRSNDDIERIGAANNVVINGSATSTDQVDNGIAISKSMLEGASSVLLPDIAVADQQAKAQQGGTVNGSFVFPDNTIGLILGPTEIMGDLDFGKSNTAEIAGPLYIHGNFTIDNDTVITQAPVFEDTLTPIIVDGTISIDAGVTFVGAGVKGAFLLVSTHEAMSGDNAAIEIKGDSSDLGDAVLYASEGDVRVVTDRTVLAVFAAHGNDPDTSSNGAVRFGNGVTVNYRELPSTIGCVSQQIYETTSHILINEFIPNPTGDDTGSAGASLDGEWVELFNPTALDINVDGWVLYDSNNTHDLVISGANTDTGGTIVTAGGYLVVYREGDTNFALNNVGGDSVRLFSGPITSGGILVDSHEYTGVAPDDKSFARIPDGSSNWIDPAGTPGGKNTFFLKLANEATDPYTPSQKPELNIIKILPVILNEDEQTAVPQEAREQEELNTPEAKVEDMPLEIVPLTSEVLTGDGTPPVDSVLSPDSSTVVTEQVIQEEVQEEQAVRVPVVEVQDAEGGATHE
ncbi:MAG: lamin tail domain-containing protein [Patescibacteria group bacterium]